MRSYWQGTPSRSWRQSWRGAFLATGRTPERSITLQMGHRGGVMVRSYSGSVSLVPEHAVAYVGL